jgi:hypothetical protein
MTMTPDIFSADTIIQNATLYNPFTSDWEVTTLAIRDGMILGFGPEY